MFVYLVALAITFEKHKADECISCYYEAGGGHHDGCGVGKVVVMIFCGETSGGDLCVGVWWLFSLVTM